MIRHGVFVAFPGPERWRGILITGPSGSGKSDLALRLIDQGFTLVADDQVVLWVSGGALYGRAPDTLSGMVEARGLGVAAQSHVRFSRVDLIVAATPSKEVERVPERAFETVLGTPISLLRLDPLEASTPAKLRRALSALG